MVGRRGAAAPGAGRLVTGGHAAGPGRQPGSRERAGAGGCGRAAGSRGGVRRRGAAAALIRRRSSRGVLRAVLGGLGEQVEDDPLEVVGQFGAVAARAARGGVSRWPTRTAQASSRSKGGTPVAISYSTQPSEYRSLRWSTSAAADLLRRHVVRGAHGDAGAGEPGGEADVVAEAGDAEVADLHGAVGEPHDVRGLQVAVDDALFDGCRRGRRRPARRCRRHRARAAGAACCPPAAG